MHLMNSIQWQRSHAHLIQSGPQHITNSTRACKICFQLTQDTNNPDVNELQTMLGILYIIREQTASQWYIFQGWVCI